MVFRIFSRKSIQDDAEASLDANHHARLPTPTPTPSIASVVHHSPLRFSTAIRAALGGSTADLTPKDSDLATDSVTEGVDNGHSPAPPPPETPSPPPVGPNESKVLYDLLLTISPKTLHAYTLAQLRPQPSKPTPASASSPPLASHPDDAPRPASPNTLSKLTMFFSTLAPPPLLHCVRCHKDFYDVENDEKDKACRVPHDDESALVSRVSGGGYETLWGCCGQTASGDGSEGPPDGWCYEGRHTTDIKRARFRADSTIHDDKLTSCLRLNCHGIRDRLPRRDSPSNFLGSSSVRKSNPSPVRSQASRSTRKRPRKSLKGASGSDNEVDAQSSVGRATKAKHKEKGGGEMDKDTSMAIDEPHPPSSKPKSKAKSQPVSRVRPPASTSTTASLPTSKITSVGPTKARTTTTKPKSTSRTLLSQSHTHLVSDSDASTRSRPRTRSRVREESRVRDTPQSRTISKLRKSGISERTRLARKVGKPRSRSPTSEDDAEGDTDEHRESEQEERGRGRKKRRVGRD